MSDSTVLELRAAGYSLRAIAEADGRCISTIRRVLARHGWPSKLTEEQRFWCKVKKTETCWLWTAAQDSGGYGQFRRASNGQYQKAHRVSYELLVGPIPAGLVIDHLCRVRSCVNPEHLEPVTIRENTLRSPIAIPAVNARKTVCAAGHPLGGENAWPSAGRTCRTCQTLRVSARVSCPQCGADFRADTLAKHIRSKHELEADRVR